MKITSAHEYQPYRWQEGLGLWEHRGKVAAVGIGIAPTLRRWDEKPETSVGAWSILAIRKAIEDAGITADQVDGLVLTEDTTTGAFWPKDKPIPEDFLGAFEQTDDPLDGFSKLSAEWILKNMPELKNVKFVMTCPGDMHYIVPAAIQAVGDGETNVCIALKGWHNFSGRYYQGGANMEPTISGFGKYGMSLAGPAVYLWAMQFERYLHKYGKTHEMMAPYVVNSKKNGLMFPEGYWYQHRPTPFTTDDYLSARWIAKPANLYDNDIPIHTAGAFVVTTADRAKDMKQKPVYALGHAGAGSALKGPGDWGNVGHTGTIESLEVAEEAAYRAGQKLYQAAGITAADVTFENSYDGFTLFHIFHIEGLRFAGMKPGEALDFFASEDISINGPHPVSPSGGNCGNGRTRFWGHTDAIQQIQGRAGARSIKTPIMTGVAGGPAPTFSNYVVWCSEPSL